RNLPVTFTTKDSVGTEFLLKMGTSRYNVMEGEAMMVIPQFPPPAPPPPEPPPEYPKTVSRGAYSYEARNLEEEKQFKEFLGIDPAGDDLDTWLSKRDKAGLEQWHDYWFKIFTNLERHDVLGFIDSKRDEYLAKLEPPPVEPPVEKWYTRLFGWSDKDMETAAIINPIVFMSGISHFLEITFPDVNFGPEITITPFLHELGLWLFFAPAFSTTVEGLIKAGATTAEANKITTLMKEKGFIKALDIMKANPLKYAKAFAKLTPETASQILKGMKKDQLAGLATNVFKASWDDALRATAPLWRKTMFAAAKHKWLGFFGLISLAGTIMGTDLWGNWSIVDNLQFMSGREADDILKEVAAGRMSKENALVELNQMLDIVKAGEIKVKTSAGWNLFQIIFAPLWDDLAALTTKKLENAIAKLEEIEPVTEEEKELIEENKGILNIAVSPADAVLTIAERPGITSEGTYDVLVGNYTIKASKEGYY
ncbi:hypothetical protein LCGC14_2551400, partial [marine sediment metagenome]